MVFHVQQVFAATGPDVLVGPEDMEVDGTQGAPSLLVACQSRLEDKDQPGFIARVTLSADGPVSSRRLAMTGWGDAARFHPVGISFVPERQRLYAVNRISADEHRIEVFDVQPDALKHIESLADPGALRNPNDVAATAAGIVLVTNAHKTDSVLGGLFQDALGAKKGSLALFEPGTRTWRIVADELPYPNGVVIDAARQRAHVAMTLDGTVRTYRIEGAALTLERSTTVGGRPDNLSWDGDGRLLVTSHDSGVRFLLHAVSGAKAHSPGRVHRIAPGNGAHGPELLLENDGAIIGALSVAVRSGTRLYLGQVLGKGIGIATE